MKAQGARGKGWLVSGDASQVNVERSPGTYALKLFTRGTSMYIIPRNIICAHVTAVV